MALEAFYACGYIYNLPVQPLKILHNISAAAVTFSEQTYIKSN
jgi:hypothetical protein